MLHKRAEFFGEQVSETEKWPSSAETEERLAAELAAVGNIDATEVEVAVTGSEARLMGEVALSEEIETATRIALSVEGIEKVRNALKVKDTQVDLQAQSRSL
ncbi:BON domain-containing protein [Martelella mediterranea]|uniref:BON domain-containing protein n=1 Tax=Martelella mediterranea TaxID=293089 RepID=A0A4R3NU25_9HYPH|nr:BON domain-containing protein [Martelella mediterranea]TCT40308.1 BON domain-containing protein [Martelella mediterranea]